MARSPTLHRSRRLASLELAELSCHVARGHRRAPSESSDSYETYVADFMTAAHSDTEEIPMIPSGGVEHTLDIPTPREAWGGDLP